MLNKYTRALLLADTAWFFGEGMLGPLFAVFTEKVGGDILNITWAWAAYLIVTGIMIMVIGKISDNKISKRKLIFAGYALNAILTFSYLLVDNPLSLLFVQMGLGVAAALATPTWDALYSEQENKKKDGFAWGLADGAQDLAGGIAILAGGFIVVLASFDALFITMGVIQIISVAFLLPIMMKKKQKKRR
jgi:MFS family permease